MTARDDTWFSDDATNPNGGKKKRLRAVQPGEQGAPAFERGDHLEVAQHLLRSLSSDPAELATDEGAMYRYHGSTGLWLELDKSSLACAVHPFAGRRILHGDREKILKVNSGTVDGAIEQAGHITRRVDFFASAPLGLAFSDGFVHATPDGLSWAEHAPDHRARVGYPNARAACLSQPCPRWLEFLRQVWPAETRDAEGRELPEEAALASACDQEAKILLLQQFLGACLVGVATRYQICLVMVGEGSNGKSTLIKVAEALFPAGTVAHVAPQDMGDEYRLALLAGKRFNTVGELPTSEIMTSERFKAIVAGDEVTARQIRQEPITFQPRAGHMYAANKLPPVADMSHGFWSRFVVLRFAQTFQRGANARELWAEMVEAEGPAIIGWMLEGAASVLAARGYTLPPSSRAEIEAWRRRADNVAFFLDECCEMPGEKDDPAAFWTKAGELFAAYSKWAKESNYKPVSKQSFADRMAQLGHAQKRTSAVRTYPVNVRHTT
jgi:P4 family phage/plasmid primase-like protien